MGLRRYIYRLYNFYLGSALVRDDFAADLSLVRNTILRVGVGRGWSGGGKSVFKFKKQQHILSQQWSEMISQLT